MRRENEATEEVLPPVLAEILKTAEENGNKLDLDVQPDKYGDHLTAAVLFALWAEKRGISVSRVRAADAPMFLTFSDYLQKGIVPIGVQTRKNTHFARRSAKEPSVTQKVAELLNLPEYYADWVDLLNLNVLNPAHGTGIPRVIDAALLSYPEYGGNIWEAFNAQRFYMRGTLHSQEFFFSEGLKVVTANRNNVAVKTFNVNGKDFKVNMLYMTTDNPRAASFALSRYNRIVKVDCVIVKNPDGHLAIIGRRYFNMAKVAEEIRKAHNGGKIKISLDASQSDIPTMDLKAIGEHHDVWFMTPDTGPRVLIGRFGHDDHKGTKLSLETIVKIVAANLEIYQEKLPQRWLEKTRNDQVKPENKTIVKAPVAAAEKTAEKSPVVKETPFREQIESVLKQINPTVTT